MRGVTTSDLPLAGHAPALTRKLERLLWELCEECDRWAVGSSPVLVAAEKTSGAGRSTEARPRRLARDCGRFRCATDSIAPAVGGCARSAEIARATDRSLLDEPVGLLLPESSTMCPPRSRCGPTSPLSCKR